MFSERHAVSLLKRGNCKGWSKLEMQEFLEQLLNGDRDYTKIDVQVPSDIRKETILWMKTQAHHLRLPRSCFYNAVDRYDLMCSGKTTNDLELLKLVGLAALRIEDTINRGFEEFNWRQFLEEYFTTESEELEENVSRVEQSLLETQGKTLSDKSADYYLDVLVFLLEDSNEENKRVLEMRMTKVLDLCIVEKRYRMYSPIALAAGVYFWYCRGAQAPWLHFLSSMCPDILKVIDWVAPKVRIVNGRQLEA